MKRMCIGLIAVMFLLLPVITGCSSTEDDDIFEIREQFFLQQTNYVLTNLNEFTGRTLRFEGMFFSVDDEPPSGDTYHFVVRFTSGCCGDDGMSFGFEVYLGDFGPFEDSAWVSVTGVLELRDSWQPNNPVVVVTEIEEMRFPGSAVVTS